MVPKGFDFLQGGTQPERPFWVEIDRLQLTPAETAGHLQQPVQIDCSTAKS